MNTQRPDRFFRKSLEGIAVLAVAGLGTATLATLFARHFWVSEILASLRIQLIIAIVPACLLAFAVKRRLLFGITLTLLFWNLLYCRSAWLSVGADLPAQSVGQWFRMATFNVYSGNHRTDDILRQIREADAEVVAILELTPELAAVLHEELSGEYPSMVLEPQSDGNFGIGLLSRIPVDSSEIFVTHKDWLPSISVNLQLDSMPVTIIATHPIPPMGNYGFQLRNAQLNSLANLAHRLREPSSSERKSDIEPREVILLGDLNLTPWSPVFDDFCEEAGLQSATAGTGLTPTWYRYPSLPFGLIIDHGLYSAGLIGRRTQVFPDTGSDHRLVLFEFRKNHDLTR